MGREGKGPRGPGPREREERGAGVKRSEGGARAETVVAVRGARRNVAVRKVFFFPGRAGAGERRARGELARVGRARASGGGGPTRPGESSSSRDATGFTRSCRGASGALLSVAVTKQLPRKFNVACGLGSRASRFRNGRPATGWGPAAWVQPVSGADTCTCLCCK
jgi:hypothetical protein